MAGVGFVAGLSSSDSELEDDDSFAAGLTLAGVFLADAGLTGTTLTAGFFAASSLSESSELEDEDLSAAGVTLAGVALAAFAGVDLADAAFAGLDLADAAFAGVDLADAAFAGVTLTAGFAASSSELEESELDESFF